MSGLCLGMREKGGSSLDGEERGEQEIGVSVASRGG